MYVHLIWIGTGLDTGGFASSKQKAANGGRLIGLGAFVWCLRLLLPPIVLRARQRPYACMPCVWLDGPLACG